MILPMKIPMTALMKLCALIAVCGMICSPFDASAQRTETVYRLHKVTEGRNHYLSGGLKSSVGGVSRIQIPITLPPNTVKWMYSFTTAKGESGREYLNTFVQLTAMLTDKTGLAGTASSKVKIPPGAERVDVYLLSPENVQAFVEKWDRNGGTFNYYRDQSIISSKHGTVEVIGLNKGSFHLGLNNPSTLDGIYIDIEVVAVVEEQVYIDEWQQFSLDRIQQECLNSFNTSLTGKLAVCECVTGKVNSSRTPSSWTNLSNDNRKSLLEAFKERCYAETDNDMLQLAETRFVRERQEKQHRIVSAFTEIDGLVKEAYSSSELGKYEAAIEKIIPVLERVEGDPELKGATTRQWIGNHYNSLAWWSMLTKDLDAASKHLEKALALDNQNMFTWGNTGLYHLLSGNYRKAEEIFLRYKRGKKMPEGKKWSQVIAEDLEILTENGMWHADFNRVRELLKIKTK